MLIDIAYFLFGRWYERHEILRIPQHYYEIIGHCAPTNRTFHFLNAKYLLTSLFSILMVLFDWYKRFHLNFKYVYISVI